MACAAPSPADAAAMEDCCCTCCGDLFHGACDDAGTATAAAVAASAEGRGGSGLGGSWSGFDASVTGLMEIMAVVGFAVAVIVFVFAVVEVDVAFGASGTA
jgi:hypothetical protein